MAASLDHSLAPGAVSLRSVASWTFVFILWGLARQKFSGLDAWQAFQAVSVLELAQVYVISLLIRDIKRDEAVPALVAAATLALIAALVLTLRSRPSYASGGLEMGLLALSIRYPSLRTAALAITLFVFQYLFLTGPFLWLHEAVGSLDANILRNAFTEFGYPARGSGPFVYLDGSTHGVNVMGSCSSSNILGTIVAGYCILVLGRRGRLVPDDISWIGGLLVVSLTINWLRLAPMVVSKEGHQFWHDGFGSSVVSLVFAALVFGAVALATRQDPTRL